MARTPALLCALFVAIGTLLPTSAWAGDTDHIPEGVKQLLDELDVDLEGGGMFRIGEDLAIPTGFHVRGDAIVLDGDVKVGTGARIEGSVIAIDGSARIGTGASVDEDVLSVNGDVKLGTGSRIDGKAIAVNGQVDVATGSSVDDGVYEQHLDGDIKNLVQNIIDKTVGWSGRDADYLKNPHGAWFQTQAVNGSSPTSRTRVERGDVIQWGNTVEIPPDTQHRGDVVVLFGNLELGGEVDGDVVVVGGHARLYDTGSVTGDFATVLSDVKRNLVLSDYQGENKDFVREDIWSNQRMTGWTRAFAGLNLFILISFGVVVLLYALFLEPTLEGADIELETSRGRALAVGAIIQLTIPLLALILAATFVLAPVSLLVLLIWALGITAAACLMARLIGRRVLAGSPNDLPLMRVLIGYLIFTAMPLIGQVLLFSDPHSGAGWTLSLVGFVVCSILILPGLGAVVLSQFGRWNRPRLAGANAGLLDNDD